ncbi:hypothetical protein MMC28_002707 [Mycoblastus sanguinarius]|nr:hypothetical protein [Mycoblastus sanguinarius]
MTSVENFQDYHNHQPVGDLDEVLHFFSPPPDITTSIELEVEDDEGSLSGSVHHSSPDEAVFDNPSRASSPRTSHSSDDDISVLDSYEQQHHPSSPFAPLKTRSPFRNPSSVRALQMDTTPPHLTPPPSQHRHKIYTPSRQYTPRSTRSHRSAMSSPSKLSPTKKLKKEYPLVLLHVTLLPIPLSYPHEILEAVLPPHILENWKLLQEKATDTVLERGILIPHPEEDYDLLEERLLESLDLKIPRILKCGHFHFSPEEDADVITHADADSDADSDANDLDICPDCGHRIRDGRLGSAGTGRKRWDIKLFAANGLMRAAAWGAAWREMERVDVEVLPQMEENLKRELELRREEEDRLRAEQGQAEREEGVGGLDDERLREIYGGDAQAFVDGLSDEMQAMAAATSQRTPRRQPHEDLPLGNLFRNYICLIAQDRRNIAIFLLSIVVLFLSMSSFSAEREGAAVQASNQSVPPPVARFAEDSTDFLSQGSTSARTSVTSTTSPEAEPQQSEEQDQKPLWRETEEDLVQEMFED